MINMDMDAKTTEIAKTACEQAADEWLASDRTATIFQIHEDARARFDAEAAQQLGLTADDLAWIDIKGLAIKTINTRLSAYYAEHVSDGETRFPRILKALAQSADRS